MHFLTRATLCLGGATLFVRLLFKFNQELVKREERFKKVDIKSYTKEKRMELLIKELQPAHLKVCSEIQKRLDDLIIMKRTNLETGMITDYRIVSEQIKDGNSDLEDCKMDVIEWARIYERQMDKKSLMELDEKLGMGKTICGCGREKDPKDVACYEHCIKNSCGGVVIDL